jgi:sec-independent protein translocase protein TatC
VARRLREFRRSAIVAITAVAGVLTPPDPFSLFAGMLAGMALHETTILALDRVE